MSEHRIRPRWAIALAVFAGIFGLATVFAGGSILFGDGTAREAAGAYVPFVVWFNFLCGFAYLAGAVGLALWRPWVTQLAFAIAILTIVISVAFALSVLSGEAFEPRTVGALIFRSAAWLGIAFAVRGKV